MAKLAGTIFKAINIFVVLLYLSACLIPILPAGEFWIIAVLGLIFPFVFLIVAGFLIGWLIARSKWFILSLTAIILSWQQVSVIPGLSPKREFVLPKPNNTLRVLSWNLSSWGTTVKSKKMIANYWPLTTSLILNQQADVLCFQEFWDKHDPDSRISNIRAFKALGYPYSYFVTSTLDNRNLNIGVVIMSKYPITNTAEFSYGKEHFAEHLIYADIEFNQQKVRIFTTHLQSVRFDDEEYIALRKIKQTDRSGFKDSKTIGRKLRNAYQYRGTEADFVNQKIKESPFPVIITGDFNDVPNSYTYFKIKGDLQDAFLKKGTGLGRTYQYLSPTLRIDFILASKTFRVDQFNRIIAPYSDHYPIVTDLSLRNSN
jgi:endonuclease/exonuclease/phosphatase family metal-dependent hydrolase